MKDSDLKGFKQQLDDSVSLIEAEFVVNNASAHDDSKSEMTHFGSDTESLLQKCEAITLRASSKPLLRFLHVYGKTELAYIYSISRFLPNTRFISLNDLKPLHHEVEPQSEPDLLRLNLLRCWLRHLVTDAASSGECLVILHECSNESTGNIEKLQTLRSDFEIKSVFIVGDLSKSFSNLIRNKQHRLTKKDIVSFIQHVKDITSYFPSSSIFSLDWHSRKLPSKFLAIMKRLKYKVVDKAYLSEMLQGDALTQSNIQNETWRITGQCVELGKLKFSKKEKSFIKGTLGSIASPNKEVDTLERFERTYLDSFNCNLYDFIRAKRQVVIAVAGMRHSGSTALFNLLRLAILKSNLKCVSGYSEAMDLKKTLSSPFDVLLIKTHEYRSDIRNICDIVITTTRDLRDTIASAKRRDFSMLQRVGSVKEYAKYNRMLHDIWKPHANLDFIYESFMDKPTDTVSELLAYLGLDTGLTSTILTEVFNLDTNQYKTTLLSQEHITDPSRTKTFIKTLGLDSSEIVTKEHEDWLEQNGYIT